MLQHTAVIGVSALGMTLVIIAGGIDLSVGSVMALSTVIIAQLLVHHCSATVAALGGVAGGAACGLLIGVLVTALRLSSFIVTLGMWTGIRGLAKGLANNTTVDPPTDGPWNWKLTWLNGLLRARPGSWLSMPVGVWMMIVLAILVALMLRYTRLGRHIFAIGSNEQTARLCGVRVNQTKIILYIACSAFAALAGLLEFSYISSGDPTTRNGAELDVIAAVVIGGASLSGGQGSILGSLVGALLMTMIANGCTKINLLDWNQQVITCGIIIAAAAMDDWRRRRATT
jgi:ribose/xylose/arabinose/galactoside ABC-type transport system permease subunit